MKKTKNTFVTIIFLAITISTNTISSMARHLLKVACSGGKALESITTIYNLTPNDLSIRNRTLSEIKGKKEPSNFFKIEPHSSIDLKELIFLDLLLPKKSNDIQSFAVGRQIKELILTKEDSLLCIRFIYHDSARCGYITIPLNSNPIDHSQAPAIQPRANLQNLYDDENCIIS